MKRIDPRHPKRTQDNHWQNLPKNDVAPVPEHRGKKPDDPPKQPAGH